MSQCRSCQAEIEWVETKNGKMMPLDVAESPCRKCNGTGYAPAPDIDTPLVDCAICLGGGKLRMSHFSSCPDAAGFRKQEKPLSDIWSPCIVCGRPAAPHGEHHYRPHDTAVGKQMGGTHDHLETLVICREHHEALHERRIYIEIADDGSVTVIHTGYLGVVTGVTVRDMRTDEELAEMWDQGALMLDGGLLIQAEVAVTFHDRYGAYGRGWRARVAEILRDTTGRPCSGQLVDDRYWQGVALRCIGPDARQALTHLGAKVLAAVGRHADPPAAIEQANEMRDEGRKMTEVAILLSKRKLDSERSFPCSDGSCVCRWCGREMAE